MDTKNADMTGTLTKEQATAIYDAKWWEGKTHREIVEVQLYQKKLICPFSVFHEAMEGALGRPVQTIEFADSQQLKKEFAGEVKKPTFEEWVESLHKLTKGKFVFVFTTPDTPEEPHAEEQ